MTRVPKVEPVRLFAERDLKLKKIFAARNTKGALSKLHMEDMGRVNSGYTRRRLA